MSSSTSFLLPRWRTLTNADRLLPSQPVLREYFRGDDSEFYQRLNSVVTSVLPIKSVHDKWKIRLKPGVSYPSFGSDLSTLHFLQLLISLGGYRRVLEIGTFVGVSTLFFAEAVGADGRVVTVEVGAEFAEIAADNFRNNGLAERIELIHGDIADVLPSLARDHDLFDFVFLDGDKASYGKLLHAVLDRLQPGGLMVVDDVFCQGDTLNGEAMTDKGVGVKNMLSRVAILEGYSRVILPYGNGQLILRKPRG